MSTPKPKSRARSKLTEKQAQYVDEVLSGLPISAPNPTQMARSETVREQLAAARRWLTDATQIRRLDVVEGIIDGIEMARMQGDSSTVIKGWAEVGKILGHYAPEKKLIELSINDQRMRSKFESMTDEELLALQKGAVIDGEATRLN